MDLDIVNALHHLYQQGEMEWSALGQKLWCGPDSAPTIDTFAENNGLKVKLPDQLMRFLKSVEDQLANLPKPDFVFSFPLSQSIREPSKSRPCFVAMPYGPKWFSSVKDIISTALHMRKLRPRGAEVCKHQSQASSLSQDCSSPSSSLHPARTDSGKAAVTRVDTTSHSHGARPTPIRTGHCTSRQRAQ